MTGHATIPDADARETRHIIPLGVYFRVFALLMVLLALTCLAASFNLGALNPIIAVGIAVAKAALIVLYFMHVRYSSLLVKIMAGTGFAWLMILFFYGLTDYFSRGWLPGVAH